jgi:hypothetical protein
MSGCPGAHPRQRRRHRPHRPGRPPNHLPAQVSGTLRLPGHRLAVGSSEAKSPLRILQSPSGRGALPLAGASTLLADTLLAASLTESLLSVTRLAVVAARRA